MHVADGRDLCIEPVDRQSEPVSVAHYQGILFRRNRIKGKYLLSKSLEYLICRRTKRVVPSPLRQLLDAVPDLCDRNRRCIQIPSRPTLHPVPDELDGDGRINSDATFVATMII